MFRRFWVRQLSHMHTNCVYTIPLPLLVHSVWYVVQCRNAKECVLWLMAKLVLDC